MPHKTNTIVFLVGLGAPNELYNDLIKNIKEHIPHDIFHVLEWWNQDDFGKKALNQYLENTNALLIGHSAGGSIAIQALADSPDVVRQVVMLDSHTLKGIKQLPSIEKFLDILLSHDDEEIINQVRNAYAPLIKDSSAFDRTLEFLSEWVKNDLTTVCTSIKAMSDHRVLHMGFTNSQYEVLDAEHENELKNFWGQYHFDTEFLPMSHFDLIKPRFAKMIVQKISEWTQS